MAGTPSYVEQFASFSRISAPPDFPNTPRPLADGRAGDEPFALSTVESWLQERAKDWSLRTLVAGAQSVDRFLDWLVANNLLAANPWGELCGQYGQRTAPIVRAILSPDPARALEALRPLPHFGSHLGEAMLRHIQRMRSLGFRYEREASRLLGFDRYAVSSSLPGNVLRAQRCLFHSDLSDHHPRTPAAG